MERVEDHHLPVAHHPVDDRGVGADGQRRPARARAGVLGRRRRRPGRPPAPGRRRVRPAIGTIGPGVGVGRLEPGRSGPGGPAGRCRPPTGTRWTWSQSVTAGHRVGQQLDQLGQGGHPGQGLGEGEQRPGRGVAPLGLGQHAEDVEGGGGVLGVEVEQLGLRGREVGVRAGGTRPAGRSGGGARRCPPRAGSRRRRPGWSAPQVGRPAPGPRRRRVPGGGAGSASRAGPGPSAGTGGPMTTASARAAIWVSRDSTSSSRSSSEVAKAPSTSRLIRSSCSRRSAGSTGSEVPGSPTVRGLAPVLVGRVRRAARGRRGGRDGGRRGRRLRAVVGGGAPDPGRVLPAEGVEAAPAAPGAALGLGDQGRAPGRRAPGSGTEGLGSSRTGGRGAADGASGPPRPGRGPRPPRRRRRTRSSRSGRSPARCAAAPRGIEPSARSRSPNAVPSGVNSSTSPTWRPMAPSPVTRAAALSRATVSVSELQRVGSASSVKDRRSPARARAWATPTSPLWARTMADQRTWTTDPETSRPLPASCLTSATSIDIAGHSPLGNHAAPRTCASPPPIFDHSGAILYRSTGRREAAHGGQPAAAGGVPAPGNGPTPGRSAPPARR